MSRWLTALTLVAASILVGLVRRCDPAREHSIYYRTKGRRDR